MSPRDNAQKEEASEPDFGDDVYARAWSAMAKLQGKDLKKVPYVTIESALGLVSTALGILATYWPVLETVRAAVDLTKTVIVTKENIRKRIAGLRLMQADMLCSLFSLRDFKREDQVIGDQMLPGRLEMLCDHIKNDVKRLGNVMENYATENWLGRILKESGWKEAVTKCGEIVETRKKEILEVIALYSARRADQIAASMDQTLVPQIASIAIDLKALQALFTPAQDEEKALKEVERLGGPEECLKSETKLNELAIFIPSDEDSAKRGPKSSAQKTQLSAAELRRIRTPVEQILERNLARFESKIDYLVDKAKREHHTMKLIRKLAGARPYERIENPDIRKLWKEMGWGGSIDSHTFVLNLYDYFIDLERESRTVNRSATLLPEQPLTTPISPTPTITLDIPRASSPTPSDAGTEDHDEFEGCTTPEAAAQDAWCLNYFNYRTLSTFMEVLDDDMNGLIKIKEVNEFTSGKPEGITLMQWIVYSAYGWLVSAHLYRLRIDWMVERIVAIDYAKENSVAVTTYMGLIQWVTAFLRTLGEPDLDDQQLLKVTHIVMEKQEQSVKVVLGMLNYELEEEDIRTMMDLSIRGGPGTIGRIEDRMLPVIYLVMQRHYAILALTSDYVLEENAFERASHTIDCITDMLFSRAVHLRENFSKLQYDVDRKIQYVANGMFQGVHQFLSASDDKARLRLMDPWYLPWRSEQWVAWALQEYDPEFPMDVPSILSTSLSQRDLVRVACASSGEPDEGYELVALYRKRYGIVLASSVQLEEPPDTPIQQDDAGDSEAAQPVQHIMAQCDGCMVYPIAGLRFKCIDCRDFDYCSTCHGKLPPPLMHPNAIAGHHTEAHRFLRVEQDVPTEHMNTVLDNLRATPLSDTPGKLVELDPLIVHCLSEPDDVVQGVVQALVAYRTHCLQANIDEEASGLADLEALDTALGTFASLPLVAEFAKSRSHLLLRMRDGLSTIHPGYGCDGGDKCADKDKKIYGDRYHCIDCPDFDFCAACHAAHWNEHFDGEHRFILVRYPLPRIVSRRVTTFVRNLANGGADLWKIGESTTPNETAVPPPEQGNADANVPEAVALVDPGKPEGPSGRCCSGPCQRQLSEGFAFRCLSCRSKPGYDGTDNLLCADCAFVDVPDGNHRPIHVLAAIPGVSNRLAAQGEAHDHSGVPCEQPHAVTNEDLSKRMDKMEETMAVLLSMVGKLQELILTSPALREV